jgi:hypothetical protein
MSSARAIEHARGWLVAVVMPPVYGVGLKSGCTLISYIQISD